MRRTGILSLIAAVAGSMLLLALAAAALVGVFTAFLGVGEVLTPTDGGHERVQSLSRVLVITLVGCGALALLSIVLDAVLTVLGLLGVRRADGRTMHILNLVAAGVCTLVPLLLLGAFWAAGAADLDQAQMLAGWMLAGMLLVLAPWARIGQLIGGILALVALR